MMNRILLSSLNSSDTSPVSVASCIRNNWVDPLCPLGVVMLILTIITLLLVIFSTVRVVLITKRIINYILGIHYCVLVLLFLLLFYFGVYDALWLRFLYELLKIGTFIIIGFFFTLSARRFKVLPSICRKRVIFTTFGIFYTFLSVIYAFTIQWAYDDAGCRNEGRLIFATSQFVFSIIFGTISYLILKKTTRLKVGGMIMSSSFMIKHTRPLTIVLFIYIWTSILNLGMQIFLYVASVGNLSCHDVLLKEDAWIRYSYPVFRQIDLLLPLWAILYYFKETLISNDKTVSLSILNDPQDEASFAYFPKDTNNPYDYV